MVFDTASTPGNIASTVTKTNITSQETDIAPSQSKFSLASRKTISSRSDVAGLDDDGDDVEMLALKFCSTVKS